MRYMGGKSRIAKDLTTFLNKQLKLKQPFIDLFCGSCNIISKIDNNRLLLANDKHKYLIQMWKELQNGWIPPKNLSNEEYLSIKNDKDKNPAISGFAGFGCSFSGIWFSGYARNTYKQNYCLCAHNSVLKKLKYLENVKFQNKDYTEVFIPFNSVIYCDIPYKNTASYSKKEVGIFDHEKFYEWVIYNSKKGHKIFISEYIQNVPDIFTIVWKKESKQKMNSKNKTTEVLFTFNGQ